MTRWAWYAVKTLYRTTATGLPARRDAHLDRNATLVEERVVLVRARSFDEAIRKGEKEARDYARGASYRNPYGQRVATRYLGECDAFQLAADPAHGREVYSRTEIVSADVSTEAVVERLLGHEEPDGGDTRRRKFVPG